MYVTIEGQDFCGKSLQADLLVNFLRQHETEPLRLNEPDDTLPTGKLLREYLKDGRAPQAHAAMFLTNRLELLHAKVLPAIMNGRSVVCSRSFVSSLVYQQEQHPLEHLLRMHQDLPIFPDKVIILDLDAEEAMKRGRSRPAHEFYEKLEKQKVNRERFLDLTRALQRVWGWEHFSRKISIVQATGCPESVHKLVRQSLGFAE